MKTQIIKDWSFKGQDLSYEVNEEGFVIKIQGQEYEAFRKLRPELLEDATYCFDQLGMDGSGQFMAIEDYE